MKKLKRAIFCRTQLLLLIVHCSLFIAIGSLFAQAAPANEAGVSLEAEIQSIEKMIGEQGISPVQRHDALVRLARLRQLSGDIEGAARNWLEAAAAIPGQVDEDALLSCAYCFAAMGDWDKAAAVLEPLLSKLPRARFLYIGINAIRTGNVSSLSALVDSGEYSSLKSEIYFMLWKISRDETAESWRRRLASEFPQTPEGRLASASASSVIVKPNPFWLFAGGNDSLPLLESASVTEVQQTSLHPPAEAPASVTAAPVVSQPAIQPAAQRLQTGLFSRESNANAQAATLRQAGFSPSIERRGEMYVVTVPVGADQARSIRELKAAGFESFPIR